MPRPTYIEVGNITDRPTQQSVKALWDRIYAQSQEISTLQSQLETLQSTVSTLQSQLSAMNRKLTTVAAPAGE